jgi:hypothetical protein
MSHLCFFEPTSGTTSLLRHAWHDPKGGIWLKTAKKWKGLKPRVRPQVIQACCIDQHPTNLSQLDY